MAVSIDLNLKGIKEAVAAMKKARDAAQAVIERTMYQLGEEIMTESKETYCPVDTGALRSTGAVFPPEREGNATRVTLAYGGPAAPYALAVHETNKNYHNGKQWKYLETPFTARSTELRKRLAENLRNVKV